MKSPHAAHAFDQAVPEGELDHSQDIALPRRGGAEVASTPRSDPPPTAASHHSVGVRALSDIDYYVLRARAELRLTQTSPRREASLIHFKLANAYLHRINELVRAVREGPLKTGSGGHSASHRAPGPKAVDSSN